MMANSFLHSFGLYILVRFDVSVIFRCVVRGYIFGAGSEKIMFCLVISLLFFQGRLLTFISFAVLHRMVSGEFWSYVAFALAWAHELMREGSFYLHER